MSWSAIDPETRALVHRVCTERQATAMRLAEQGMSQRAIAYYMRVHRSTVQGYIRDGWDAVERARRKADAPGVTG